MNNIVKVSGLPGPHVVEVCTVVEGAATVQIKGRPHPRAYVRVLGNQPAVVRLECMTLAGRHSELKTVHVRVQPDGSWTRVFRCADCGEWRSGTYCAPCSERRLAEAAARTTCPKCGGRLAPVLAEPGLRRCERAVFGGCSYEIREPAHSE